MKNKDHLWRSFFAVGLMAIAIQQFPWHDFRPVILPPGYPAWLIPRFIWVCILSAVLIIASATILVNIKARATALVTGTLLLLLFILFQISSQPTLSHLYVWSNPLKELTLSGGAFLVAGSLAKDKNQLAVTGFLEKLIPLGKYFFAITMIVFGITHFVYTDFAAMLVPNWIPWHLFWTYLAGAGLIAGGIGIVLNIKRSLAATLLGIIIFIWLIVLHIPRAIADPFSGQGNEWTSVFEALAFSGIAFLIGRKKVRG